MYCKGSIWRKWDFHVHTPASKLAVQFGNDWDIYVKKLVLAAYSEKVDAIGITDYFSIEGYKKLKSEYFSNNSKLEALFSESPDLLAKAKSLYIFPNVELRLDCFIGSSSVNYHVIFSDQVKIEDIEEYFLGELDFVYEARPQDQSHKMKVKKANLEELGRRIKADQPNVGGTEYEVGLKSAVVNVENIKAVLGRNSTRFKSKYLLGVPSDEDLSDVSWNGRDGDVRRQIIGGCDFILSGNSNTANWAVGRKADSREGFLKEFKTLKPCLWGSDAHSYPKLLKPDQNRYTWIKSELSFEGLKQVKYEPDSRVSISSVQPDSKISYYVIDKIRFRDGTNSTFSTDWIEINQNLTTIIGGKSSGKSLLLYYLAKTINIKEASKLKTAAGDAPYGCENDSNFDFEVCWADGEQNSLRQDPSQRQKNITYLPQLYINSLVEGKSKDDLNRLIEDVLLENKSYGDEKHKFTASCRTITALIEQSITLLFSLLEQKEKTTESLIKLGNKAAHLKQIEALKNKIQELKLDSTLNEEEKAKFDELNKKNKELKSEKYTIDVDLQYLNSLHQLINSDELINNLVDQIDNYSDSLIIFDEPTLAVSELVENVKRTIIRDISPTLYKLANNVASAVQKSQAESAEKKRKIEEAEAEIKPFLEKFKNRSELSNCENQLKSQSQILTQFEMLEKKLNDLTDSIAQTKLRIWEQRNKYREVYQNFLEFIKNSGLDRITDDIKLVVSMKFDEDDFHMAVVESLNLTTLRKVFGENYDDTSQKIKKVDVDTFKILLEAILSGEVRLKAGIKKDDLLRRLLRNYLTISFNLRHKEDDLFKMSPGKRGIVVLKLLLQLSNSKDPILIDQPEDNLDNRTIYEELISFIKEKKTKRQIIMVTHNANLVVSTDAEEVIVCNQGGQDLGRENSKCRFEYAFGPLERSFIKSDSGPILPRKGIKEHVCDILEGGKDAFINRQTKYELTTV